MSFNLQYREELAILTIDRPDALNALSFALIANIGMAIDAIREGSARALIVTGAQFTGYGALAIAFGREAVKRALSTSLEEGLRAEADLSTLAYRTTDAAEGMQGFLDKRSAPFKGR